MTIFDGSGEKDSDPPDLGDLFVRPSCEPEFVLILSMVEGICGYGGGSG